MTPTVFCLDWITQGSQTRELEGSKEEVDGGNTSEKRKYSECPFVFPRGKVIFTAQVALYPIISSSAWLILKSLILSHFSLHTHRHVHMHTHSRAHMHTPLWSLLQLSGCLMHGRCELAFQISTAASGAAALLFLAHDVLFLSKQQKTNK